MSVISREPVVYTTNAAATSSGMAMLRRTASGLLLATAVFCLIALVFTGALLAYGLRHSDTVFTGVQVGGTDVGGMTPAEARAAVETDFAAFAQNPIEVVAGDTTIETTPAELGVSIDAQTTVDRAYDFGRTSDLWHESRAWLNALAGGHDIPLTVNVDKATFAAWLERQAGDIIVPATNATFVSTEDGVTIVPGVPGVGIDMEATFLRFEIRAQAMSNDPVEIVTVSIPPTIDDPVLEPALADINRIAGQPLRMTLDGTTWEIPAGDLYAMLQIDMDTSPVTVEFDEARLRGYIRAVESQTFIPATDAAIRNDNGKFTVEPAHDGHKLDIDASHAAAVAAIEQGSYEFELATVPVAPNVTTSEVEDARKAADALSTAPLELSWDGGSAAVEPTVLAKSILFDVNASRNPNVTVALDMSVIEQTLAPIAEQVKVEPKDAELRWIDGQVTVRTPETPGRELDVAATVKRMEEAIRGGTGTVAVVTKDVQPKVNGQMAAGIQFPDKLAEGMTEYGSSAPDRLHNVELAASRLNGAMVAPGAEFSFNRAVGEVTLNSGYRTGYGIIATNGNISTIPSVGGGICQVATTVFHAAFRSGMPITTRSWHLYWIPRYGQPPSGMKGLDATVDPDYGLDFTFKNATDKWIAIKANFDGSMLRFELWGTNPGWEINIDDPVITNIRPASQEMFYEKSDELPAGTSVFVEHAEDGFDADIHRVVKKDGNIIDEVTLHSTYAPARNVTLVGTGS